MVSAGTSQKRRKVLLFAEGHVVRLLDANLKRRGYEILCAFTREQAQQALDEPAEGLEIVILDSKNYPQDSEFLLQRIRERPETASLRVFFPFGR